MTEVELEITTRNGYFEFSMHNESGQGQDHITPRTDNQRKLLEIWRHWHLNGMNAGTPEQDKALEERPNPPTTRSYEENCAYLKSIGLYEVEYQGKPYKYGHGWIHKDLPDDFLENIIEPLLDELDVEEENYSSRPVTEDMIEDQEFIDKADELNTTPEKLMAMCLYCDVSVNGIENIEED